MGDEKEIVDSNRKLFFRELGLTEKMVRYQKQVHEDKINRVSSSGSCGESDALITTEMNLGLAISSADCPAIFIYDPVQKLIAAVHSGWKGTEKKILRKTIQKLKNDFNSVPANLICYIGPSISQKNYEVGEEVASKFENEFVSINENKFYLNLSGANYKMLVDEAVRKTNIQVFGLCSYEYENILHSYTGGAAPRSTGPYFDSPPAPSGGASPRSTGPYFDSPPAPQSQSQSQPKGAYQVLPKVPTASGGAASPAAAGTAPANALPGHYQPARRHPTQPANTVAAPAARAANNEAGSYQALPKAAPSPTATTGHYQPARQFPSPDASAAPATPTGGTYQRLPAVKPDAASPTQPPN